MVVGEGFRERKPAKKSQSKKKSRGQEVKAENTAAGGFSCSLASDRNEVLCDALLGRSIERKKDKHDM